MTRPVHIPIRTCMGCGAREPQSALLRIVLDPTAGLRVDAQRRARGRGGYLHPLPECWTRFSRRKGPLRSLRASVDRAAREALLTALRPHAGE